MQHVSGVEPSLYRYLPLEHQLLCLFHEEQMPQRLTEATLGQAFVGRAAVVFIWTTNARRPDLILLDVNLPRKDGRQVLAEIKADPELCSIPAVVLTFSQAEIDVATSYDNQANCYIVKPVDLDGLMKVVKSIEGFWVAVVELPKEE